MSRLFDLSETGYFYTRLQNPTNDTVAAKICEMEGGAAAMLTSSGQAANFFALFQHLQCGRPHRRLVSDLRRHVQSDQRDDAQDGIECTFVSPDCTPEELDAAFQPNTKPCSPNRSRTRR